MSAGKNQLLSISSFIERKKKKDLEECRGLGGKRKIRQTPAASFVAPVIRLKNKKCLNMKHLKYKPQKKS